MTYDIIESIQGKPHHRFLIIRSKKQHSIGNFIFLMIAQTLCKLQKNCGKRNDNLMAFVLSNIFKTLGGSDQREREIGNRGAGGEKVGMLCRAARVEAFFLIPYYYRFRQSGDIVNCP
jgi:hypothetical protein